MKVDHTRYLGARPHAALTLFDPGAATRRAEYRSFGLFRFAMWADDAR
jgi:hypothetical protein